MATNDNDRVSLSKVSLNSASRLDNDDLSMAASDEVEKLMANETTPESSVPAQPEADTLPKRGSKSDSIASKSNVIIQAFDPNMFDKFKKKKIEIPKLSDEESKRIDNPEVRKLIEEIHDKIDQSASNLLFSWHNLPIVFPPPVADISNINIESLFKFPTFDELDEVAIDSNGNRKNLNEKQFDSIQRRGEFEVESKNFEGKTHRWVLSRLLQKGYEKSNESFFQDMANSLHLLIITAKRRFYWRCFSVLEGIKSIGRSVYDFIDILIGLPQMRVVDYQSKLNLEKIKFLVGELRIDPSQEQQFNHLCNQLNIALEKNIYNREKWIFPHFYIAPDNLTIDLRLYDTELQKKIGPVLVDLLKIDTNEKLVLNKLRDDSITLLTNEGLTEKEIIEKTSKIVYKEYLKRLNARLINSAKLETISPGIGKLLCQHAQSVRLIEQVCDEIMDEFHTHMDTYEEKLRKDYRIKSLIRDWLQECLDQERERYLTNNSMLAHEKAIDKCREERLAQATYFLLREMLFYKNHEKELIESFKKIKEPTKTFRFHRKIWFPSNYIIEKSPNSDKYQLKTDIVYKSDTRYPFWRWKNFFIRTAVHFSNLFFWLGLVIPFVSPLSFSALFRPSPFFPGKKLNYDTGKLETDPRSRILTFSSRLGAIWSHVSRSVERFESTADKGLISKNIQRVFNRIWNYFFVGFLGSVGLSLVFPPLCLLVSTGSLVLLLLSPIWFPLLNILFHLFLIMIYDWDYPRPRLFSFFKIVLFDFLLCGIIQPISALVTATVICPITSFILLTFGVLRKSIRKTWDSFMFYAIIKRQAKVPSGNTFLAKRLAGPGLSANYFYQARAELIVISLEAHLEAKMIRAYFGFVEKKLREPLDCYLSFFNPLFNRYSYLISQSHAPFSSLNWNVNHYVEKYRKEMESRTKQLNKAIEDPKIKNIRLVEKDLDAVFFESVKVVRKHYEQILKYQGKNAKDFFEEKLLALNDWEGLTKIELEEVFGVGINTPLEQTDTYFNLVIDHLDFGKYSKMIADSKLRDDLDAERVDYRPRRSRNAPIQIQEDSVGLFDPRTEFNTKMTSAWTVSEKSTWSKLTVPTKLPSHLALTALIVDRTSKNATTTTNKLDFTSEKVLNAVNQNEREASKLV